MRISLKCIVIVQLFTLLSVSPAADIKATAVYTRVKAE